MKGYVLRRTYFDNQVGSIGQSFYSDGLWHTISTIPPGVKLMELMDISEALKIAKIDASKNGF